MNIKGKTITLDNSEQYVVMDTVNYANHNFVILSKVIDNGNDVDSQIYVAENTDTKITFVNDQTIIDEILRVFRG